MRIIVTGGACPGCLGRFDDELWMTKESPSSCYFWHSRFSFQQLLLGAGASPREPDLDSGEGCVWSCSRTGDWELGRSSGAMLLCVCTLLAHT